MLLQLKEITKTYKNPSREIRVLDKISLGMARGETLALTGESGSGKSTLLHLIGALDGFDAGEIILGDIRYSGLNDAGRAELRRTRIGVVFQQFNLVPTLTVDQNLAFHSRLAHRTDSSWTAEVAERLGLTDLADRLPEQLSGGQQQRVAIGRALALKPDLLLADEPTGNLDEQNSDAVLQLMLDLVREVGTSLFMVTHSERLAAHLDRHVHLRLGQIA
ncbi:MAG: ABC transporter ATP-binding protein [Pseudomonadota bacterium]